MSDEKNEIIPIGKSPVHETMEWAIMYELLCKQVASAFGVSPELLAPSNTACSGLGLYVCSSCGSPMGEKHVEGCSLSNPPRR